MISHIRISRRIRVMQLFVSTALLLVCTQAMIAQPSLNFRRAVVNWPIVELYFSYGCDSSPSYEQGKDNFRIFENGREMRIENFWCPDPYIRCAVSVSLVVDVSGSMGGHVFNHATTAAGTFIDQLDGVIDEVALIRGDGAPAVIHSMSERKTSVVSVVDTLTAGGTSALYDAIHLGLEEVIRNGVNQCRAIVVITDGGDNASVHSIEEIIFLANRHRIRIFILGQGEHASTDGLELIAELTGGKYFYQPGAAMLVDLYKEISTISMLYSECLIAYKPDCPDGSTRDVELRLENYCGGTQSRTRSYRLPLDSSSFTIFDVHIPRTLLGVARPAAVPVLLDIPDGSVVLPPFELELLYDSTVMFHGISAPSGTALFGIPHETERRTGALLLRTLDMMTVEKKTKLFDAEFSSVGGIDLADGGIRISSMMLPYTCNLPRIVNDTVSFSTSVQPEIIASALEFCEGDSVTLEGSAGFSRYLWSTGDTTRAIRVGEGGTYRLTVVDHLHDTLDAGEMAVIMHAPRVWITADGPLEFCRGAEVTLTVDGDTARSEVRWSNGQIGNTVTASSAGAYWATVTTPGNCIAYSDTVHVLLYDLPVHVLPGYDIALCPGESVVLSVDGDYAEVRWGDHVGSSIRVHTPLVGYFEVRAEVTDSNGCKGLSRPVIVRGIPVHRPGIAPSGSIRLCRGASVELTADTGFAAYTWSTGETGRSIVVDGPGVYTVEGVTGSGCMLRSEPVHVTHIDMREPRIAVRYGQRLCSADSVILDGGDGYVDWLWSNGERGRVILAADSGLYWVEVTAYGGCRVLSDTILVSSSVDYSAFEPTLRGSLPLCPGDTLWIDGPPGMAQWLWNTGSRERSLPVTGAGRYAVTVVTQDGCETVSGSIDVVMAAGLPPTITREGNVLGADSARAWQWYLDGLPIPGATERFYHARATGSYTVRIVDEHGCTLVSPAFVVSVLSMPAPEEVEELIMYPEPAGDGVYVVFPSDVRDAGMTVFSLLGRVMLRHSASVNDAGGAFLDVRALPSGVYLLHVVSGERWWLRKLVKK
jgi:hypothetical protein